MAKSLSRTRPSGRTPMWHATWRWCMPTSTTRALSSGRLATRPDRARTSWLPIRPSRTTTPADPYNTSATTTSWIWVPTSTPVCRGYNTWSRARPASSIPSTYPNTRTPWATPWATSSITGMPSRAVTSCAEALSGTGLTRPSTPTPPMGHATWAMAATTETGPTTACSA